jgi:hypothetical protein
MLRSKVIHIAAGVLGTLFVASHARQHTGRR